MTFLQFLMMKLYKNWWMKKKDNPVIAKKGGFNSLPKCSDFRGSGDGKTYPAERRAFLSIILYIGLVRLRSCDM